VLSSPWSLEFVLAVIIGAMLVPGCRPDNGLPSPSWAVSTAGSPQFSSSLTVRAFRSARGAGRPEIPPAVLAPVGPVRLRPP
jgi:hypothetical protein